MKHSILVKKYRLLEYELEKFDLVSFLRGKDNTTLMGFSVYALAPTGIEFLLSNKPSRTLNEEESKKKRKEEIDSKLKEYQVKTFWILFFIAVTGGFINIGKFVLDNIDNIMSFTSP